MTIFENLQICKFEKLINVCGSGFLIRSIRFHVHKTDRGNISRSLISIDTHPQSPTYTQKFAQVTPILLTSFEKVTTFFHPNDMWFSLQVAARSNYLVFVPNFRAVSMLLLRYSVNSFILEKLTTNNRWSCKIQLSCFLSLLMSGHCEGVKVFTLKKGDGMFV